MIHMGEELVQVMFDLPLSSRLPLLISIDRLPNHD